MVGAKSRRTDKNKISRVSSSSGSRIEKEAAETSEYSTSESEEAQSTEEEENSRISSRKSKRRDYPVESDLSSSTASSSTSRQSLPVQNEDNRQSKKFKITPIATLPPSTSSSHLKSTQNVASVSTGLPSQQVPIFQIPPIMSSPEWIISLTTLLTAIDPRLSNLALSFEKAGVQDKEAVMEMMHFSEIGLDRLTQKMIDSGAGMTIMQKMLFKKGVIKIRGEM